MQILEKVVYNHPCFNEEAHDRIGRIHLPVAPKCNIQCNFCERKICMNVAIHHPGWTARIISPLEALDIVHSIIGSTGSNLVIGVAGPGDPLANESTFEALKRIHSVYPDIMKCMSTNGLLLEDRISQIIEAGVSALTVTINAATADIGSKIYSWVRYKGHTYRGLEASQLLISKQFRGVEQAVKAGLLVKINSVLVPGINDQSMAYLASRLNNLGVSLMNIMPLIPCGRMKGIQPPNCDELKRTRQVCEVFVPQFYRCEHCRADTIHIPPACSP
jgi:nitrogen fixation protein NifB